MTDRRYLAGGSWSKYSNIGELLIRNLICFRCCNQNGSLSAIVSGYSQAGIVRSAILRSKGK